MSVKRIVASVRLSDSAETLGEVAPALRNDRDPRLLPKDPSIVTRRHLVGVIRAKVNAGSVVHLHSESAGDAN